MPERLETHGFIRAIDEESRRVTVVVSTGDLARDDAIIEQSGWDLRNYERNPVVLWAHNDRELPIARAVSSQVGANELVQVHEFASHPRAEEVWQAVRSGFVNATSVRWYPGETEWRKVGEGQAARSVLVFTRGHQLLESSYVPVPADAGCLVLRADGERIDMRAYAQEEEPEAPAGTPERNPWLRFAAGFMAG